jgi:ribosomal protein L30/L7E
VLCLRGGTPPIWGMLKPVSPFHRNYYLHLTTQSQAGLVSEALDKFLPLTQFWNLYCTDTQVLCLRGGTPPIWGMLKPVSPFHRNYFQRQLFFPLNAQRERLVRVMLRKGTCETGWDEKSINTSSTPGQFVLQFIYIWPRRAKQALCLRHLISSYLWA